MAGGATFVGALPVLFLQKMSDRTAQFSRRIGGRSEFWQRKCHGIITALGIGLQNMPEGLIVAVSLIAEGYRTRYAVWISFLTAVIEPLGSFVGFGLVSLAKVALPLALALAAGAMLFVICDVIIP
jgi:zinc transporter ZupT